MTERKDTFVQGESEETDPYRDPYCARVVDLYYPSGKKFRKVYLVFLDLKDGRFRQMTIRDSQKQVHLGVSTRDIVDKETGALGETTEEDIKTASKLLSDSFGRHLDQEYRQKGIIVDSPMNWDKEWLPKAYDDQTVYNNERYPRRYQWSEKQQKWFMPKDRQDIN